MRPARTVRLHGRLRETSPLLTGRSLAPVLAVDLAGSGSRTDTLSRSSLLHPGPSLVCGMGCLHRKHP